MDDIENNIRQILPSVSHETLEKIVQVLAELGANTQEDLRLVEVDDLIGVLTPIAARKLIKHWRSLNNDGSVAVSESSSSTSSRSVHQIEPDWDFQFEIPWKSFPKRLLAACENGERPLKSDRLQMVRIVVDQVYKCNKKPILKNMERIAYKIVSRYPDTFKDVIDGIAIGSGIESLVSQLMYRSDNLSRADNVKNLPRTMQSSDESATTTTSSFTDEDQNYLKSAFLLVDKDEGNIQSLMDKSFVQQRDDIEKKSLISELKRNWPFLFDEKYLLRHCEKLLDRPENEFKKEFLAKFCSGGESIYKALEVSTKPRIAKVIGEIEEESRQLRNNRPKMNGVVKLILSYFDEKHSYVYQCYDAMEDIRDIVRSKSLPKNPLVLVQGMSPTQAREFFVVIEDEVVAKTETFTNALLYAFCCFYVFSLQYPKQAESTFNFIQRYFAKINYAGKSVKRSRRSVPPKVLKLVNEITLRRGPSNSFVEASDEI